MSRHTFAYFVYIQIASTAARFLEDELVVTGRYTAFSSNKKMVAILHRELEHKVEKVKHMKLEVMRPKTQNNMNFQPEYTITDKYMLIVCDWIGMEGRGRGGGLINFSPLKRGGAY